MPNNNTSINGIKTDITWIKQELRDLKENHLVSIYRKLDDIEKDMATRPTWLISGIITLLVGLLMYVLTR